MTTIQMIRLDHLELSPLNVRKVRSKEAIERMAASIEAHGILQNFRVHTREEGKYGVVIGGTRLAALNLLLKRKKITTDFLVPCDVRPISDPSLTEVSLAENVVRDPMHPADEFDAFKKLADEGQGPETIAARFGVTPTVVKQRLKLAVVSPKLIAAYRKEEMTLDQLMAFTVSDDRKQQEKVWAELPDWNRQRGDGEAIRAALTEQHIAADSKLARFGAAFGRPLSLSAQEISAMKNLLDIKCPKCGNTDNLYVPSKDGEPVYLGPWWLPGDEDKVAGLKDHLQWDSPISCQSCYHIPILTMHIRSLIMVLWDVARTDHHFLGCRVIGFSDNGADADEKRGRIVIEESRQQLRP